jgi:hypothetical protein
MEVLVHAWCSFEESTINYDPSVSNDPKDAMLRASVLRNLRNLRNALPSYNRVVTRSESKPATDAPVRTLQTTLLARLPWLVHGFSTRTGGHSSAFGGRALNLGFTPADSRAAVELNRTAFLTSLGAVDARGQPWPLVTLRQTHSNIIHCVDRTPEHAATADGVVTRTPGLLLAVQTADCLPILLVDSERRAVGAFHAGWRGTLARIVEKGVAEMRRRFGTEVQHIHAAIGAGIGRCCYEVGGEVREQFASQFDYGADLFEEVLVSDPIREKYPLLFMTARPPGHSDFGPKLHLDLVAANHRQLLDVGLPEANIEALGLCTACRTDLFFSYRAEHGPTGRLMGAIGLPVSTT